MSKIPGAVWGGLMVALPLISVWLEQNFGAYGWTPAVAGLLLIAVKVIEVVRDEGASPAALEIMREAKPEQSKTKRILWG
jgi:hypothetical protein